MRVHPLRTSHVELLLVRIGLPLFNNCLINLFKGPPGRLLLERPFDDAVTLLFVFLVTGVVVGRAEEFMEAEDEPHRESIRSRP